MKKYLIASLFLITNCVFGQSKVTDFTFETQNSVSDIKVIDSLGDNIIFYALGFDGGGIWKTDGTQEGTIKVLSNTQIPSLNTIQHFKISDFLYITFQNNQGLFRTDGETLEVIESSGVKQVVKSGENLLYLQSTKDYKYSDLLLITENEPPRKIDDSVTFLTNNEDMVYYVKSNSDASQSQIVKFDPLKIIEIASFSGYNDSFVAFNYKDYTDFIFRLVNNQFLYRIYQDNSFEQKDLGSLEFNRLSTANFSQPNRYYVQGDPQNIAFFSAENIRTPAYNLPAKKLKSILDETFTPTFCCSGIAVWSYNIINNKLLMQFIVGSEGISRWHLTEYDLKTENFRVSKNLISEVSLSQNPNISISESDSSTYILSDNYKSFTFNFALDSVLSVDIFPTITDSVKKVNFKNKSLEFSDNIYDLANETKSAFIEQEQKAVLNSEPIEYYAKQDTLQLLHFDQSKFEIQYWISDGKDKNDSLFAGDYAKTQIYLGEYPFATKVISTNEIEIILFFGTKKLVSKYLHDNSFVIDKATRNKKEAIIRLVCNKGISFLRIDNEGVVTRFDSPNYDAIIYQTNDESYLLAEGYPRNLYSFGIDKLILVANSVSNFALIRENKIFYAKAHRTSQNTAYESINFIESGGEEKTLKVSNFNNFYLIDEYLFFGLNIYNLETDSFIFLGKNYSINAVKYVKKIGGKMYYFGNELFEITANKFREIDIPGQVYDVQGYFNGLAISSFTPDNNLNLFYYDLITNELFTIIKSVNVYPQIGLSTSPIIAVNYNYKWGYWNALTKSFLTFNGNTTEVPFLISNNTLVTKDYSYSSNGFLNKVYTQIDNSLSKVKEFGTLHEQMVGNRLFFGISDPISGQELAYFHIDSIFNLNEIIQGTEGVFAPYFFYFKNNLYVKCFTYRFGWQVWNFGELKDYQGTFENKLILAVEPINDRLIAYPNPAENQLYFTQNISGEITIIDITGRIMLSKNLLNERMLDISQLPTGKYILQVIDKSGKTAVPLVKH